MGDIRLNAAGKRHGVFQWLFTAMSVLQEVGRGGSVRVVVKVGV
jgi:hypothetical protein